MRLIRSRPLAALVVAGIVLVVGGGAWFVGTGFGAVGVASFGWFEYTTTPEVSFRDGIVVLSRPGASALVLCAVGAVLLSVAGGFALGRRAPAAPPATNLDD